MQVCIYVAVGPFSKKDDLDDQEPTVRIRNLLTNDFLWIFAYWGTICGILLHVGPLSSYFPSLTLVTEMEVETSPWFGGNSMKIHLFKVLKNFRILKMSMCHNSSQHLIYANLVYLDSQYYIHFRILWNHQHILLPTSTSVSFWILQTDSCCSWWQKKGHQGSGGKWVNSK